MENLEEANKKIEELKKGLKTLLQEPDLRDQKRIDFFYQMEIFYRMEA